MPFHKFWTYSRAPKEQLSYHLESPNAKTPGIGKPEPKKRVRQNSPVNSKPELQ